ncbi:hypothetical protein [Streptomyces diastaticus]|uniref:hypothetical protein n=1 Tax=Streptomyces diastaticus TaxID=1956 RepID=UPI0034431D1C
MPLASVLTSFVFLAVQHLDAVLGLSPLGTGLLIPRSACATRSPPSSWTAARRASATASAPSPGLTVVPPAVPWLTRLHEGSGRTAGVPEPMTPLGIGGGLAVVPVSPTVLTATRRENRGVAPASSRPR